MFICEMEVTNMRVNGIQINLSDNNTSLKDFLTAHVYKIDLVAWELN